MVKLNEKYFKDRDKCANNFRTGSGKHVHFNRDSSESSDSNRFPSESS